MLSRERLLQASPDALRLGGACGRATGEALPPLRGLNGQKRVRDLRQAGERRRFGHSLCIPLPWQMSPGAVAEVSVPETVDSSPYPPDSRLWRQSRCRIKRAIENGRRNRVRHLNSPSARELHLRG